MAQKRNSKSQAKKEMKSVPLQSKNGRRSEAGDAPSASVPKSWFSLVLVLALVGIWSSMAVVYFDVVDYDSVIGKLSAYDSDSDGDFDLEDAKVLLGLNKDGSGGENAESLEEVISVLSEEGSDWLFGFFSFLFDVVSSPEGKTQGKDEGKEKGKGEDEALPGNKKAAPIRGQDEE